MKNDGETWVLTSHMKHKCSCKPCNLKLYNLLMKNNIWGDGFIFLLLLLQNKEYEIWWGRGFSIEQQNTKATHNNNVFFPLLLLSCRGFSIFFFLSFLFSTLKIHHFEHLANKQHCKVYVWNLSVFNNESSRHHYCSRHKTSFFEVFFHNSLILPAYYKHI